MSRPLMFPGFDPVAFHVFSLPVRWYALAYVAAFLCALPLARLYCRLKPEVADGRQVDDFLAYAIIGVVLGGRLGFCLFYQPDYYLHHPLAIPQTWNGGMSFHGGVVGVVLALLLFCRRHKMRLLAFADRICAVIPLGLFFGRLANFINGELWGRAVQGRALPWAMVFPRAGMVARHPSQLYEALGEGALLFLVMLACVNVQALRTRPGFLSGLFLFGYAWARGFCEFFREPDAYIGYLWHGATMGQLLCVPMGAVGLGLMGWAFLNPPVSRALWPESQSLGGEQP